MTLVWGDNFELYGDAADLEAVKHRLGFVKPKPPKRLAMLDEAGSVLWSFTPAQDGTYALTLTVSRETWLLDVEHKS